MSKPEQRDEDGRAGDCSYEDVLRGITRKQQDVFELLAESRTSKEIAARLGISESAVNQRIEAVRSQTGFPPRADLARAYARLRTFYVPEPPQDAEAPVFATRVVCSCGALPGSLRIVRHAPLTELDAGIRRLMAMVAIAIGLLVTALVALSVAQALSAFL